jgi:spore coat protein CotH
MKFKKTISILLLTAQSLLSNAESVTFKVLAVNGTPILNIGGQQYQMELDPDRAPLYKVKVDVDSFPVKYNYILDSGNGNAEAEQFERVRNEGEKALNEFFNRSITVKEHPLLPKAFESFEYYVPSKLYDDTHVSTILIECDPNILQQMYNDTENKEIKAEAKVTYASPYGVRKFNQAILSLSGQSTRGVPKLSYTLKNLKDDNNKELFDRSTVKLRAEHMDPSYLRDKLYGDVLNSLGVPAAQNKLTRVFINNEPIGLFDISDDIPSGRYLRETFNKGEKYPADVMNPIFKADYCPDCPIGITYGDLGYYGEDMTNPMYAIYTYKGDDETVENTVHVQQELLPLLKEINDYGTGTISEMSLDIDSFLKYMAMEFVSGGIDNYWVKPGNYYVFKDLTKNKWYFHDADFHFSFGVGGEPDALLNTSLAQYPPLFDEGVTKARGPLDAIRSHPENEEKFKKIIERLLSTALHPEVFNARLKSLADLIREDAQWDMTLPRVNPKPVIDADIKFTPEDFESHVTSDQPVGIDMYPIKYFLNNRISSLTTELGIQVPAAHVEDIGVVENPSQNKNDSKSESSAVGTISYSVLSSLIVLFVTLILY